MGLLVAQGFNAFFTKLLQTFLMTFVKAFRNHPPIELGVELG
jgi:hypothetical protein